MLSLGILPTGSVKEVVIHLATENGFFKYCLRVGLYSMVLFIICKKTFLYLNMKMNPILFTVLHIKGKMPCLFNSVQASFKNHEWEGGA